MLRIPKVYIETSVFNFVFADDAPDKRNDTLEFFKEIEEGKYTPFVSEYVIAELQRAPEPKRGNMLSFIKKCSITYLPSSEEAQRLANIYVAERMISIKYMTDALHI